MEPEDVEEAMPAPRRVVDPAVLKALAHPLRRRAIEALMVAGPATVGMLAETLGEAVGKVSFHVAQLARHGLVEEVPELAKDRRERWWRTSGFSWSDADFLDDPVDKAVADAAFAVNVNGHLERVLQYREEMAGWGKDWADAAYSTGNWLELTPAELRQFTSELEEVFARWAKPGTRGEDEHRERVYSFIYAFPRRL
ncbi:ArsR/SmtB family transcription factor [Flindersiella endophytica]